MTDPLREAAQAVLDSAEPDDDFEGQFTDYLVPAERMDALHAALATPPATDPTDAWWAEWFATHTPEEHAELVRAAPPAATEADGTPPRRAGS